MHNVTLRHEVLKLNEHRVPIDIDTPKRVFGDLIGWLVDKRRQEYILDKKGNKQRKMLAFDIDFEQNADGSYNFDVVKRIDLVDGDQWLKLPIRSFDLAIRTPYQVIRVPRVVMALKCENITKTTYGKSLASIYDLYDGTCAYTRRKLKRSEANRDHVIPLSKGGKDDHSNIVLCDAKINTMKGNKFNSQVGLPEVVPIIPKEQPRFIKLRKINKERQIPEWRYFLGD